jgi:hypothetical protein
LMSEISGLARSTIYRGLSDIRDKVSVHHALSHATTARLKAAHMLLPEDTVR